MRLSQTVLITIATACVAVDAAPAPSVSQSSAAIAKRENLESTLAEFRELQMLKVKRDEIGTELTAREYEIVTEVLTWVKDTDLVPTILKYFVENDTLSSLAIDAVVYVVKSGLVSAESLLSLLVQSGLITDVLNDLLTDCDVYESFIEIGKSLLSSLISDLLKRDDTITKPMTHDEGVALLRRNGLIKKSKLEDVKVKSIQTRDLDDVVINVLESLGDSGLASQVVETVLTDSDFLSFGAELIETLYDDGLLSLSSLVSAVSESGLLSQLFTDLFNTTTLSDIVSTAISAFSGDCSSSSSNSTSTSSDSSLVSTLLNLVDSDSSDTATTTSSSASATSSSDSDSSGSSSLLSVLSSLVSGSSILSGVTSLIESLFDDDDSSSSSTGSTSTTTVAGESVYACTTDVSERRKRMRIY